MKKKIRNLIVCFVLLFAFACKSAPENANNELEDQLASNLLRITELEKLIRELKQQNEENIQNLEALKAENGALIKNNQSLQESINQEENGLKSEIIQLNNEIVRLTKVINELTIEKNDLESSYFLEKNRMSKITDSLKKDFKAEIENGTIELFTYEGVLVINISNSILFKPDSPILEDEYKGMLKKFADIVKNYPEKIIRVEGHTASALKSKYSSSWTLGAERAVNVVQFFQQECKLDPSRLLAVSFGEYRPITLSENEEEKAKNRRVQIVLLDRPIYKLDELTRVK